LKTSFRVILDASCQNCIFGANIIDVGVPARAAFQIEMHRVKLSLPPRVFPRISSGGLCRAGDVRYVI